MLCPKCNAEMGETARFCWQCGAGREGGSSRKEVTGSPARTRNRRIAIYAAAILIGAALALLLAHARMAPPVTATSEAVRPAPPVTATPPPTPPTAPALPQAPPPATPPAAPALPQTPQPAPDPYRESVAEYLRKLEGIQQRDADNPMAQLITLLASSLNAFNSGLRDLLDEEGGQQSRQSSQDETARIFTALLQQKQAIAQDFTQINPVPAPCATLHRQYGAYLAAQLRSIARLQQSVQGANPTAPLAALPGSADTERARAAANEEEQRLRRHYNIPRAAESLVPQGTGG